MSTSPAPTVNRGDITLQPGYFTSSLFVYPLREDISTLVQLYTQEFQQSDKKGPFVLFKKIWNQQGWTWLHFRIFDGRARERFISVVLRLFSERMADTENPMTKVVALFGLYTFYFSQPSTSSPSLYSVKHLALPIDVFQSILSIPAGLVNPELAPLRPYATHVLSTLLDSKIFHILPESSLNPQNPTVLPREIFTPDTEDPTDFPGPSSMETEMTAPAPNEAQRQPKTAKKGRPTKREKAKKARGAVASLEKWLDKNTLLLSAAGPSGIGSNEPPEEDNITHLFIANPPTASRKKYSRKKEWLLDVLDPPQDAEADYAYGLPGGVGNVERNKEVLGRVNEAVLTRLKKIDEMAAEEGLEVGGEGGEMTGLLRVEKAVEEFRVGKSRGGILDLMEGAGMEVEAD